MQTLRWVSILILIFLSSTLKAQESSSGGSGISGSVSIQEPNTCVSSGGDAQVKEVVATGIGIDGDSATRQALTAAVQQAVGSYLDTKTITENEEVIKDRILTLSNGFVSKYDVISPAKKRDDGLYEITIKAQVQGGQVVAKLKEVILIKGEVAGQNIYAQGITKIDRINNAIKMLEEKLPEILINIATITLCNDKGEQTKDFKPITQVLNINDQTVCCTWLVKVSIDPIKYREGAFPVIKRCLDAVFGETGKPSSLFLSDGKVFQTSVIRVPIKENQLLLLENISKSQDHASAYVYNNTIEVEFNGGGYNNESLGILVTLLNQNKEVVSESQTFTCSESTIIKNNDGEWIQKWERGETCPCMLGYGKTAGIIPGFGTRKGQCSGTGICEFIPSYYVKIMRTLKLGDVKSITKMDLKLVVPEIKIRVSEAKY